MRIRRIAVSMALCSSAALAQPDQGSRSHDPCHFTGEVASHMARARAMGRTLAEWISSLKQMADGDKELEKKLEEMAIDVFRSKLSPDDAYLKYRRVCSLR